MGDINTQPSPISIVCSYAYVDEAYHRRLDVALSPLRQRGLITYWYGRQILAGADWEQAIDAHFASASVILLLISPDFMASEYCYGVEMRQALRRNTDDGVPVIPIILRPVDWRNAPFARLQVLPTGGKPVISWENQDDAFLDIATGIEKVVDSLNDPMEKRHHTSSDTASSKEHSRLLDRYLEKVVTANNQLPWGYLPGNFAALEVDDVYILPRLSSKEQRQITVSDEWLERELLRRSGNNQEQNGKGYSSAARVARPSFSSIHEVLQAGMNSTFLGYMGSGKSMAVNYIALQLARGDGQRMFGIARPKIPIVLRLGRARGTPSSDLVSFAIDSAVASSDDASALADVLKHEWNADNALLIIDALDEFRGDMQWISDEIVRLSNRDRHGSNLILTSRPSVYRSIRLAGMTTFTLEELQREEVFEFVATWVKAYLKITQRTDVVARDHARFLADEIGRHSLVQEIASNQLLLTVLTILSLRPEGIRFDSVTEAGLLDAYITDLIERERSKGAVAPEKFGTSLLRIVYSYAGFEVQRAQSGMFGGVCTYPYLLHLLSESRHLRQLGSRLADAEAMLNFWLNTGLLQRVDDETKSIRFRHQAFQYLGAALAMTFQSDEGAAKILADVETNPGWADVRRIYFGLKAHPDSILE